jgi:large subunit ribosomal protein L23
MNNERIMQVILSPMISEKTSIAADSNRQYTFRVAVDANKHEVARAVENLFDVKVERVQVLNVKGKTKRSGRIVGKRSDWRKAIVRLQEGNEIDFAAGA